MKRNSAGTNHKTAALWNRRLVLRLLREHKTLSRIQISHLTGLRGSTLTYIVRELIDKGLVLAAGKVDSKTVGAKQISLNVNARHGHYVGVALRPDVASVVAIDAATELVGKTQFPIRGPLETVPAQLDASVKRWFSEIGEPPGRLLGIGVGVPGVVSSVDGIVLRSSLFNAARVPLRALMESQFGCSAQVDHDACFGAVAEAETGAAQDMSHFIYYTINHNRDSGLIRLNSFGSALYLEGHIFRGAHYAAGEIDSNLVGRGDIIIEEFDLHSLGTEGALMRHTLQALAQSIGTTLASIVNLLDVQCVVVGGNCNILNRGFLTAVEKQTELMLIPIPGRQVRIVPSQIREGAVALGAAVAASHAALDEEAFLHETVVKSADAVT